MSIWDDLYGDFMSWQRKIEGYDGKFRTVEAKVDDLRRRVGLVSEENRTESGMEKSASLKFRLSATAAEQSKVDLEIIPWIRARIDARRGLIDSPMALFSDVRDQFRDCATEISTRKDELLDIIQTHLSKYKTNNSAPSPRDNLGSANEKDDSAIFESVSDKIKR